MATLEQISPAEETFDRWRRRVGIAVGPLGALGTYAAASGLPAGERYLSSVLVLVIIFWVTEAIPIPATALLGPALCAALGVAGPRQVFSTFADPIIFVFLGAFLLARAMSINGLDRSLALRILRAPAVGQSPARLRLALGAIAFLLSMWISNTATVAILFPITVGILNALESGFAQNGEVTVRAARSYGTGVMLMIAYAASVGGLATPIGSPPNLVGLSMLDTLAQRRVPFFDWMLVGLPVALLMFGLLALLLGWLHPAPQRRGLTTAVKAIAQPAQPWGRAQTYTVVAFLLAVTLWVLPGAVALVRGAHDPLYQFLSERLHEGVVALLAASLLFLLPVDWSPLRGALPWQEAVRIDWGTILLFGGGLSLGGLMYSTGLAPRLAQALLGVEGNGSLWGITAVATLLAVLISETTSNAAAASMVVPVAIAVAQGSGVSPLPPALGATMAASLSSMLPVSTPPNAIVYGSGRVRILEMIRAGTLFDLLSVGVLLLVLRLLAPLLGWV